MAISSVSGQMITDDSILLYDNRKMDNDFLSSYTFGNSEYFFKLGSLDTAYLEPGGYYYGCGIETSLKVVYYFDMKFKSRIFGYNSETEKKFLMHPGDIAVTSSGKIYVTDEYTRKIYYWQRDQSDTFSPAGSIDDLNQGIMDICTDENDFLYSLIGSWRRIYKYNTDNNLFVGFGTDEYIQLPLNLDRAWLGLSGIEVNENGIYIIYSGGGIVKFDADGEYVTHYRIDETNLQLMPGNSSRETDTFLISITSGPYGNIYVLDKNAGKVHIFNPDLAYISSWEDSQRPFESDVSDLHCIKENGYFFITYPWGFYSYKLHAQLTGISVDQDVDDVPCFFCVYDKRLIDNAYTFIDETVDMYGNASGEIDRNYAQLNISGFTWHCRDNDTSTNTPIYGRVAYNYSGQDSPGEFNQKMSQQVTSIQWFHWFAQEYELPVNAADYYPDWNDTFAPFDIWGNNVWENYVTGQNAIDNGFGPDGSLAQLDSFEWPVGSEEFPLLGIRPYIPGLSSYNWANYTEDFWYLAGQGAGVDCVGFVHRAANYYGNNILLADLGEHPWSWIEDFSDPGGAKSYLMGVDEYWRVFPKIKNGRLTLIASKSDSADLGKVMPGDVFYYPGGHVGFVDYVDDNPKGIRKPIPAHINLIESTHGSYEDRKFGCVTNHNTLDDYEDRGWIIGRLVRN